MRRETQGETQTVVVWVLAGVVVGWICAWAWGWQMEKLGRGVVAIHEGGGKVFVSWRLLGSDPEGVGFNIYRRMGGGEYVRLNREVLSGPTWWVDEGVDTRQTVEYLVRAVVEGQEEKEGGRYILTPERAGRAYLSIPLKTPEGYAPNDASVGDLDGDGEYEIVLHQAGRAHDNAHAGETDPPILQAYKLDGRLLWEINLGRNIREGAHYTQFIVYDLDGDGRAEVACKTADGTVDGKGKVIGDAGANWVNERGYILKGPEYLTIFDGLTGAALATVPYVPPRHPEKLDATEEELKAIWGDGYGNRMDRFLACVAYLDGQRPSLIMCRGYYTRTVVAAWDWRDGELKLRWVFDSDDPGHPEYRAYRGQGNHNLSVADVDGDGRDEIVYGACVIDDDGRGLYSTGLGHGDALHVGDLDPERPGLEVFGPHENMMASGGRGATFRDARTGEVIWFIPGQRDVGRAMAADIDPRYAGVECWASNDPRLYSCKGEVIAEKRPGSINFGIWWDGDLLRELLDHRGEQGKWHGVVYKWDWEKGEMVILWEEEETRSNNWTKGNPCLSADILGDWREEMIWRSADNRELRIYVSTIPTEYRMRTLMHDRQYRVAVAWQNVGYNQPPHPGFFLGVGMKGMERKD